MIDDNKIKEYNNSLEYDHQQRFEFLSNQLAAKNIGVEKLLQHLADFQVAIPSWALGRGGTRFGRFHYGGEPRSLEEKLQDVGLLQQLTKNSGVISLHIPWDIPKDIAAIKEVAVAHKLVFDAVNSNTFQDQTNQNQSYLHGSLSATAEAVRAQAIAHNKEVIDIGQKLGSKALTVWLADGSNFPGQRNLAQAFAHTAASLGEIYAHMPLDWRMLVEYKPFEPNFYHTVIQDWGSSYLLAAGCGDRAFTLVDLGHHLPNTNIEQIVAMLLHKKRLGGFHFNDSKYADDDLTVGSIKPYALFLIFCELVTAMEDGDTFDKLAWMIDASHNIKDPMEDLLQSVEAMMLAFAQALLVDRAALAQAQEANDVTLCQQLLQNAYRTDVRPLVTEARKRSGGALYPLGAYRHFSVRKNLIKERGSNTVSTGL